MIRKPGDAHAQDRILEIAGLTGKRAMVRYDPAKYSHASAVAELASGDYRGGPDE